MSGSDFAIPCDGGTLWKYDCFILNGDGVLEGHYPNDDETIDEYERTSIHDSL